MAVIKLSPFTTGISGSMKNLAFSTDGVDTIMKERETPANPKTGAQSAQRGYFGRASKGYAALTPSQAAAWGVYAKGLIFEGKKGKKPYVPNAYEAYTSLSSKFYGANAGVGTAPATPPSSAFAGDSIGITASASSGNVTFTASAANASNVVTELWLQPLKNANRKPSSAGYRVKAYQTFSGTGLVKVIPVPAGYYAAQYRFINKTTGQSSPLIPIPVGGMALIAEDGGAESTGARKRAA